MDRHEMTGRPAPRFALPVHAGNRQSWSLDDALAHSRAVVVIFHRHIH